MENVTRELRMLALGEKDCPFEDWFNSIRDKQTSARIRARLIRIRNGNMGDCKPVGNGVNELRLDFGPGYRIYFAVHQEQIIVLIVGGDKSTQSNDIAAAHALWETHRNDIKRFQRNFL